MGQDRSPKNSRTHRQARKQPPSVKENRLLALLPAEVRKRLAPGLERVHLELGKTIFRSHDPLNAAYFPEAGVISVLTRLHEGETLEVGLIGSDGMAGISLLPGVNWMPCDGVVVVPGTALRLSAEAFKQEARRPGPFHDLMCRYAYALFVEGIQAAACNNFHSLKERCLRWLLMMNDLAGDEFLLTHEVLSTLLGARRPSVTLVARALQRSHLIDYRHGRMRIRDRRGLEAAACECYQVIRDERRRLLGF